MTACTELLVMCFSRYVTLVAYRLTAVRIYLLKLRWYVATVVHNVFLRCVTACNVFLFDGVSDLTIWNVFLTMLRPVTCNVRLDFLTVCSYLYV